MPGLDLLIAFAAATAVFAAMPGPAILYVAAQTVARGARAGWMAVLGVHIGGYAHVVAAALGLAVLFEAVPTLHGGLKLVGATYLIWLGVSLWRRPTKGGGAAMASGLPTFRQSMVIELLNPKTALFYLAFLPQFADPTGGLPVTLQLAILGTVVNVAFSSADAVAVIGADRITRALRGSATAALWMRRLGGGALVGLGLHLALDRR